MFQVFSYLRALFLVLLHAWTLVGCLCVYARVRLHVWVGADSTCCLSSWEVLLSNYCLLFGSTQTGCSLCRTLCMCVRVRVCVSGTAMNCFPIAASVTAASEFPPTHTLPHCREFSQEGTKGWADCAVARTFSTVTHPHTHAHTQAHHPAAVDAAADVWIRMKGRAELALHKGWNAELEILWSLFLYIKTEKKYVHI